MALTLAMSTPTLAQARLPTRSTLFSPTSSSPSASSQPAWLQQGHAQPALRPPSIPGVTSSRRSFAPPVQTAEASGGGKKPKLSLQTCMLPQQPASPALPLTCSADTPTTRNTLANSFRTPPVSGVEDGAGLLLPEQDEETGTRGGDRLKTDPTTTTASAQTNGKEEGEREPAQAPKLEALPYGLESVSVTKPILRNSPLAKLILARRDERRSRQIMRGKANTMRVTFADASPAVIPRPAEDMLSDESDASEGRDGGQDDGGDQGLERVRGRKRDLLDVPESSPLTISASPETIDPSARLASSSPSSPAEPDRHLQTKPRPRPRRRRRAGTKAHRTTAERGGAATADEGHQLRDAAARDGTAEVGAAGAREGRVPSTPETPSPRNTREWVWTLGDDFEFDANKFVESTRSPEVLRAEQEAGEAGPVTPILRLPMPGPRRGWSE